MRTLSSEKIQAEVEAIQTRPWPLRHILPLKNFKEAKDGWPLLGVLKKNETTIEPVVYQGEGIISGLLSIHSNAPLENRPGVIVRRYASLMEMVTAGWIVD